VFTGLQRSLTSRNCQNTLKSLLKDYTKQVEATPKDSHRRLFLEHRISQLQEALKKHHIDKQQDFFQSWMNVFFALYEHWTDDPKARSVFVTTLDGVGNQPAENLFDNHLIKNPADVIIVEKTKIHEDKWLFEFITIKDETMVEFKKKLLTIPTFRETIEEKGEKRHYSDRYVFRPYPLAVQLLLEDKSTLPIPDDLKDFLNAAIRYFLKEEWRTSIVLSAISIESVLADFYEDINHEPAPDEPLGNLLTEVLTKYTFPDSVKGKIRLANKARNAAVHRSRYPVSDTEAINALTGATNFILWSHMQSKDDVKS
jgi:hypothetical protein